MQSSGSKKVQKNYIKPPGSYTMPVFTHGLERQGQGLERQGPFNHKERDKRCSAPYSFVPV